MGQQQSKKTKKNGKDKEKDLAPDAATPPEGVDNDGSPQGTTSSPPAGRHSRGTSGGCSSSQWAQRTQNPHVSSYSTLRPFMA